MKKNNIFKVLSTLFTFAFLFTACEKEIFLDYRHIEPLYVIEGKVTNETTEVLISQTRDMEVASNGKGLNNASIVITGNDGIEETLVYQEDGYYRSQNNSIGEPGKSYTLSVKIDEKEYISNSNMHSEVEIADVSFNWMEMMGQRFLFLDFSFQDIENEENYFWYRIYRNGENYKWSIGRDKGRDGNIIEMSMLCMTERKAEENKEEDRDEILYEGDIVEVEIRTIDRQMYDYLNSLSMSESTSANPVSNFTNGALGYFTAHSAQRKQIEFSYKDIQAY